VSIFSLKFFAFFVLVFFAYWQCLKNKNKQNILLLISSYVFYSFADWRMSFLLIVSTIVFYTLGVAIAQTTGKKTKTASILTAIGFLAGIGLLFYFKYFNFFIEGFTDLAALFGLQTGWTAKVIIFPLGVSYFSFKFISYIYEISQENINPEKDFITFASYIAFFPTITAGPIDKPQNFLPQLNKERIFEYSLAVDGCRQILFGTLKKVVFADNLLIAIESGTTGSTSIALFVAVILWPIYIYMDFSGYSDIAIGIGKLLGFRVQQNFNYPYFSRNIAEYWRRWHISLTKWVTDYVFTPLNFSFRKKKKLGTIAAILINFLVIALWHEGSSRYILFGIYNAILFIPIILCNKLLDHEEMSYTRFGLPVFRHFLAILGTYCLICVGNFILFFTDFAEVFQFTARLFQPENGFFSIDSIHGKKVILGLIALFTIEWISFKNKMEYGFCLVTKIKSNVIRYAVYIALSILVLYFIGGDTKFVYEGF